MKKILIAVLATVLFVGCGSKKLSYDELLKSWNNYEVSTVQVGTDGTKFLKVWGYGKNVSAAIVQAKKNAVHACLFRGIPGTSTAMATPAIVRDPNVMNDANAAQYFYDFFETTDTYIQFVNVNTDGMPSGQDRREVKGGYKVALYVQSCTTT